MDKMLIQIHSIVDIITNSSTMIYTGVTDNAVSLIEQIIDNVLLDAGSELASKDLYDIEYVGEPEYDDDNWEEYDELETELEKNAEGRLPRTQFAESGGHAKSYVKITPKKERFDYQDISKLLGGIFYVREDYG